MERIGSNIRIDLINEQGIPECITNDFKNEVAFKIAIYNCSKNAKELENVLRKFDKFGQEWEIEYEDNYLMIFKHQDAWGNLNYLHIKFN